MLAVFELAVERARFEAERARRQFDAVEPENRLVGRTLERRLEQALAASAKPRPTWPPNGSVSRPRSPTRRLAWLDRAGADLRAVFHAPTTTLAGTQATAAGRHRRGRRHGARRGAPCRRARSSGRAARPPSFVLDLNKTGGHFRTTDEDTVDLVRRLAERYDDKTIAAILSKQGRRTGTGLPFTKTRVAEPPGLTGHPRLPAADRVTAADDDVAVVSITKAEQILGVSRPTLYRWMRDGFITGEQLTPGGPWHIRITDELRSRIVPEVPDGWLGLDQAAKALGVARQTVLHKVQRGELQAVHVNRGRRKGLRIKVKRRQPGLFDTPR